MSAVFGANRRTLIFGGLGTSGYNYFADGTAAAPSITFASDTQRGFYSRDTNSIGFANDGVLQGYLYGSGGTLTVANAGAAGMTCLAAGGINLDAQGSNQNITLTPSGTGGVRNTFATTSTYFAERSAGFVYLTMVLSGTAPGTSNYALRSDGTEVALNAPGAAAIIRFSSNSTETARFSSSANLLIGTTTDSSNGRLQLATNTTSAGGIGFGTDTSLFRVAQGNIALSNSSGSAAFGFYPDATRTLLLYCTSAESQINSERAGSSLKLLSANALALTLDASQNATFAGAIIGGVQALSGAGAINVTQLHTNFTSTGVAQALTLANGTAGQIKTITHTVDGGSGVLTPTTALGYTTITFVNVGDSVTLRYTTVGWAVVGSYGAVIA